MSKYRDALKKLDELEAKRRELDAKYVELRRSIIHHGVKTGEFDQRSTWVGDRGWRTREERCDSCGRALAPQTRVVEYLDDFDDQVISRRHEHCP